MNKIELREINLEMGKMEYDMYQDIPAKESGSTNLCYGLPFEIFPNFIESQLARKYNKISYFDTPTIIYIIYADNKPVGYIGFRTKINKDWKHWCGNLFYAISKLERNKGYATKAVSELIKIAKSMKMKTLYAKYSDDNFASEKVLIKNGFKKIDNEGHYKLPLV